MHVTQSKNWAVQFIVEVETFPLVMLELLEFEYAIKEQVAAAAAYDVQKCYFPPEAYVPYDPDEPCANLGTHFKLGSIRLCIHWNHLKPLSHVEAAHVASFVSKVHTFNHQETIHFVGRSLPRIGQEPILCSPKA